MSTSLYEPEEEHQVRAEVAKMVAEQRREEAPPLLQAVDADLFSERETALLRGVAVYVRREIALLTEAMNGMRQAARSLDGIGEIRLDGDEIARTFRRSLRQARAPAE